MHPFQKLPFYLSARLMIFAALILGLALAGCSSDSSSPIGAVQESDDHADHEHDHGDSETPLAWVWGYDADAEILTAYHSHGGEKRATFAAHIHPMIRIAYAPSETRPTIWMGSGETAQAFTAGFYPHMDHGHMVTPEKHFATSEVHGPAHMSVSHDGMAAVFANDASQTFTVVDVGTGAVTTAGHGSPHSSALMTGQGHLLATHMQENWARLIDPLTDTVVAEMPIGSGAHGDAYYAATGRAFVACVEGIEVIDTVSMMKTKRLPYPAAGRTSFLYHAGETPTAIGLHNLSVDGERQETDSFLLINMMDETLEAVSIPGASLDWSSRDGRFALSQDGRTAVFSDLNASRIHVVDVDPASADFRSVTTITAPAPGVAVGVGERGEHLFVLAGTTVYPVDLDGAAVDMDGAFAIKEGTDWIYVTSFVGEVIDESVNRGDTVLNPEDMAVADDADDDHDHGEAGGISGRLLIADDESISLRLYDLETETVTETWNLSNGENLSLYRSPSGRFGFAVKIGGDGVHIVDGGIYEEDHGDHFHLYEKEPLLMNLMLAGENPVHVVERGYWVAAHHDRPGTVSLVNENLLAIQGESYAPVLLTPGSQHGSCVPIGEDHFVVTTPNPQYVQTGVGNPLPIGVHVRDLKNEVVYAESDDQCPMLHGEAGNGTSACFGCADSVLVVEATGDGYAHFTIPNPAEMTDRIGTLLANDNAPHYFGFTSVSENAPAEEEPGRGSGVYLIDTENREMRFIMTHQAAYQFAPDGSFLAVLEDSGDLFFIDPVSGMVMGAVSGVTPAVTQLGDHNLHVPDITIGAGKVFVASPTLGAVVQVDVATMAVEEIHALGGAPTKMVYLGILRH